jgi:hypothetical protein
MVRSTLPNSAGNKKLNEEETVTKRDKTKCIRMCRCKERRGNYMSQKEKGV